MTGQSSRPARRSRAIEDHQPLPKRRKIRKGTTSCWECKRRKSRCHFPSLTSEVCVGCQQRETPCVTQEYEEDSSKIQEHLATGAEALDQNKNNGLEDRLERVEALLQKLVDTGVSFSSPGINRRNADTTRPCFRSIEENIGDIFSAFPGALQKGAEYNHSHSRGSHAGFGGYKPGRTVHGPVEIEPNGYENRGGDAELVALDSTTMASPSFMWHRIVSQDRYLALMLGLPPGTPDDCLGSPEDLSLDDCPMGYLERIHCIIMSRITASRGSKSDSPTSVDLRSIDLTLEKAARGMPPDWWQPPIKSLGDGEPLEDVLRIIENTQNSNKSTCVNASRELLNRYIRFRCMDSIAFCCTSIDFSAFTACLTLLLAHLRRWHNRNGVEDDLAHQRLSDRAMVQETIELMIELGQECGDTVLEKTTGIVSNLARIEADAAKKAGLYGDFSGTRNRCAPNRSLRLMIPSFGVVSITRDGIIPLSSVTNSKGEGHNQKSHTSEHPQQLFAPSAELFQDGGSRALGVSSVGFDMNMLQIPPLQNLGSQEEHVLQLGQFQSQRGIAETSTANKSDFSFYFDQGMDEWPLEAAISLPECTDEQHDLFSGFLGSCSM
ncbi:hypothetical protein CEP54_011241 [Fusarium duplospermum]|uniref:Zn(2)-C6 fungal-type domain-containing protein n=1 Tax=Fusarium duplospermum TaxID=1325734 RepID=A0A428PFJ2_9HYPO|nr:hypothetical protein CEP54_011241 [Fusarium duplospermum]